MRGVRSLGLLALYVGAQLVALALALPFRREGLMTNSSPNSPTGPLYIVVLIVLVPLVILLIAKRPKLLDTLRWLILLGIGFSLAVTLDATLALVLPAPMYLPPYGAAFVWELASPIAMMIAIGGFLALLMEPQWYVVDTVGFLAAGALVAIFGISFGILPVFILLGVLAVYDAIAVYKTKHMVALADVVTEMKLPILMVVPTGPGYDYTKTGGFQEQRNIPVEEREAMFMGLGDIVFPGILVVSSFAFLPTGLVAGLGGNLWVAFGALLGSLVGYAILMQRVVRGNAQAGLPFLNGGAILGYVLTYLIVFRSLTLGFQL